MRSQNKLFGILVALIIALAALPRAVELISGNYLFEHDQGLFFTAVKKIVIDKKPTLIGAEVGGQGGFFQGPGWYYLLAIPFALTGGNPYGAMFLMFILGLATVIAAIFAGKRMFDWQTGLLIGFLVAVSPAIVAQSRIIWPPFPVSLLVVFILYSLWSVLHRNKKFLPPLALAVGALFHFEVATAGTLVIQLVLLSPFLLIFRLVSIQSLAVSTLFFLLMLSPLILFDLRHGFIISQGVYNLIFKDPPHAITQKYVEAMFNNHVAVFQNNFWGTFPETKFLWPVIVVFGALGLLVYLRDRKISWADKAFLLYLGASPVLLFGIFMLYLWPMWEWWILELLIYYVFLIGVLWRYLWQKNKFRIIIATVLVLFFASYARQTVFFYKTDLVDHGGTHKIRGKLEAIDTVYQDARGGPFNLLVFTPPIYTYAYDYLLWWHGQRRYGYLPGNEKKDTFYLLIEPDPHKPWTYAGWLETVIKTGKVIRVWRLPSGFIIEKRVAEEL